MSTPRNLDQWLAVLRSLRLDGGERDGGDREGIDRLGQALRLDRPGAGVVIAAAARRVVELGLGDPARAEPLIAELPAAFERLLAAPAAKRDPGCRGKLAIARALHELDRWEDGVFVRGLTVTQPEGYGESIDDTAAPLRGICGLAHAHFARRDALDVLAELLADPEPAARVAAARGLGDAGRPDATALLRYLVLGDEADPEVLAASFESLFTLAREPSIGFAIRMLDAGDDERAEAAALALGSTRAAEALEPLVAWCEACVPARRQRAGFLALALLRTDPANAYLLGAVRTRVRTDAVAAARALATFREDAQLVEQLRESARAVKDRATRGALEELLAELT